MCFRSVKEMAYMGKWTNISCFPRKFFWYTILLIKQGITAGQFFVRYILSLWKKELPVLLPVYLCFNFSARRKAIWSLLTSYYIRSINILSDFGNVSITHNTHFFSWLEYAALCGSSFFIRTLLELYNGSNLVHIAFFKVHMETNNRVYTYFLPAAAGFPSVAPLSFYSRQCDRYCDKHFYAPPAVS